MEEWMGPRESRPLRSFEFSILLFPFVVSTSVEKRGRWRGEKRSACAMDIPPHDGCQVVLRLGLIRSRRGPLPESAPGFAQSAAPEWIRPEMMGAGHDGRRGCRASPAAHTDGYMAHMAPSQAARQGLAACPAPPASSLYIQHARRRSPGAPSAPPNHSLPRAPSRGCPLEAVRPRQSETSGIRRLG